MERTTVLVLNLLQVFSFSASADRPNYITPEEFSAIATHNIIPVANLSYFSSNLIDPPFHSRPGFGFSIWPNARVPYTLDSKFNDEQRLQVAFALKTYHDSTCIRFTPKLDTDSSWVDIIYDESFCGAAQQCMQGGSQFAKFGGSCATTGVMVHELGHTLCMGHEQSRLDRDSWITFDNSKCNTPPIDGNNMRQGLQKLYDYVSVEHYEGECYSGCYLPKEAGVTKCGSGGSLSVLDIEILNDVYQCTSGCLGYRYVNSKSASLSNLVEAGQEPSGDKLYSCRAYHQGDIIPGKYHPARGECYVAHDGEEHTKTGEFIEVLTNPNKANFQWKGTDKLPPNAVRGGRSSERETLYVIRCSVDVDENGTKVLTPGKYQPSTGAYTSYGFEEIKCVDFEFLVCIE